MWTDTHEKRQNGFLCSLCVSCPPGTPLVWPERHYSIPKLFLPNVSVQKNIYRLVLMMLVNVAVNQQQAHSIDTWTQMSVSILSLHVQQYSANFIQDGIHKHDYMCY